MKRTVLIALALTCVLLGCGATTAHSDEAEPVSATEAVDLSRTERPRPTRKLIQTPEPEPVPCPLTDTDIRLLSELMTCEAQVVVWNGEKWGVSAYCRIAAVGWVALNRLDAGDYGDTLEDVIKAPYQFAWRSGVEAPDWIKKIAEDVVRRWWAEKTGESDVGRTIPSDYLWFYGDGRENYFRNQYQGGTTWGWSLPDPYKGGAA